MCFELIWRYNVWRYVAGIGNTNIGRTFKYSLDVGSHLPGHQAIEFLVRIKKTFIIFGKMN